MIKSDPVPVHKNFRKNKTYITHDAVHEYPDLTVHLTLFNATIADGEPVMPEHNDIKWITPSEIPEYDFCPVDVEIMKEITKR